MNSKHSESKETDHSQQTPLKKMNRWKGLCDWSETWKTGYLVRGKCNPVYVVYVGSKKLISHSPKYVHKEWIPCSFYNRAAKVTIRKGTVIS